MNALTLGGFRPPVCDSAEVVGGTGWCQSRRRTHRPRWCTSGSASSPTTTSSSSARHLPGPADQPVGLDADEGPRHGAPEAWPVAGRDPVGHPPRPPGRGGGAGEGLGQVAVGPGQQLDDPPAGVQQEVGEVGVGVEEREHPTGLAARHQPRRDGEAGPVGVAARRPEGDRAAEAPAQSAYGVVGRRGRGGPCGWSPVHASGTVRSHSVPQVAALDAHRAAEVLDPPADGGRDAEPALGLGLPRAGRRDAGSVVAHRDRDRVGRGLGEHPRGRVGPDVGQRRCRGRRGPRRPSRSATCSSTRTAPPGVGHLDADRVRRGHRLERSREVDPTAGPGRHGVLLPDQRAAGRAPAPPRAGRGRPTRRPRRRRVAGSSRAPAARRRARPAPAACAPRPRQPRARRRPARAPSAAATRTCSRRSGRR